MLHELSYIAIFNTNRSVISMKPGGCQKMLFVSFLFMSASLAGKSETVIGLLVFLAKRFK